MGCFAPPLFSQLVTGTHPYHAAPLPYPQQQLAPAVSVKFFSVTAKDEVGDRAQQKSPMSRI